MRVSDQVNVTDGFFFWIMMKITSKQLFDKIEKAGAVHDANNLFERKAAIEIQKGRDDSLFSSSLCIFFKKWGRRSEERQYVWPRLV